MRVSQADQGDEKTGRLLDAGEAAVSRDTRVMPATASTSECQKSCDAHSSPEPAVASTSESKASPDRRFLWLYVGIVGSLLLRLSVLDYESGDYKAFLSRWYDYFVEHGRFAAFKDNFSGYPLLYLYVVSVSTLLPLPKLYAIKLFSILCDYVAAWYAFKILRHRFPHGPVPWVGAFSMLFLPTVWLNSAVWGQCDVMFTTGLLATLYYLLVKRPLAGMVAFGLACALKPQAIYFVPFLAGWFFRERMPWRYVVVPPVVYELCGLPAILAGRPVLDVLVRGARHTNYPELTMGATNWYQWVNNEYYQVFFLPGIVLAMVATVFLILAMQERVHEPTLTRPSDTLSHRMGEGQGESAGHTTSWLLTAALLSVLMVPYFLPGMHERYFYPADLLSLIYAFFVPRGWIVAVLVQFCSFFTYLPYLFKQEPVPRPLLALVMTVAVALVAVGFVKPRLTSRPKEGS